MLLDKVLSKCPWTLVLFFKLKDLGGEATVFEIAKELGIRTYVVKRGLWWLKKFKITMEAICALDKIVLNKWVKGNTTVVLYGNMFYVFICRSKEVVVKTVPKEVVNTVRSYTMKGIIDINALYEKTGFPKPLISLALRVIKALSK